MNAPDDIIYIVTASETYYPEPGPNDWLLVTHDFTKACERARSEVKKYQQAYVIRIMPSGSFDVPRHYRARRAGVIENREWAER